MAITDKAHHLLFGVRRSVRYHNRRRNFYDRFDQQVSAISLIMGSATVYGILSKDSYEYLAITAAFIVTVLSAINLVIGSSKQAREHSDLAKQFIELEKKIISMPTPTEENVAAWTDIRLDIELKEPPVLHVLNSICHNEQARSMGYEKKYFVKIAFYQRLFASVVDIREHTINKAY